MEDSNLGIKKPSNAGEQVDGSSNNIETESSIVISCGIELKKKNGKLCVSSRLLSKRMGIDHKSIVNTLTKHADYFKEHGDYPVFKIRDKSKSGREKVAFLIEDQSYLLLALSRNTKKVVQLKSDLVKAFSQYRRKHEILIDRYAKLEYQQNREAGKLIRRDMTNIIKPFAEYSTLQGSKGAKFLYSNITRWTNKACGIESIETADELQLPLHSTACDIVANTINKGMSESSSYKEIKTKVKCKLEEFSNLLGLGVA